MTDQPLHPGVRVGHVHLKVADLERAVSFYRDVIGLSRVDYGAERGHPGIAFLSVGEHYNLVTLSTWGSEGGGPAPAGHTGVDHFALHYPDRDALAWAVRRLYDRGHPPTLAADGGAVVGVRVPDPDGNTVELLYERPRSTWYMPDGRLVLKLEPFDPLELLREPDDPSVQESDAPVLTRRGR